MSKSTFIIGLIAACLVHSLLFIDFDKKIVKAGEIKEQKIAKILIPPLPKPQRLTQPDVLKPVKQQAIESFEKVVAGSTQANVPDRYGDYAKESDEGLPSLRLVWDSPEHLIRVSKALGLKVLPVNNSNEPIRELRFERDILVGKFYGELSSYSNRVRTISSQFFGSDVTSQCKENVRCFWVIIPSEIDQSWIAVQKQALRSKGLDSSQVSYMEARIVNDGNVYKLIITRIETV